MCFSNFHFSGTIRYIGGVQKIKIRKVTSILIQVNN
jgi:hypothetical protein